MPFPKWMGSCSSSWRRWICQDRFAEERRESHPVALAVNKIDQLTEEQTNQVVQGAKALGPWPVFAISALEQTNLDQLVDYLVTQLPEGPQYYPDDYIIDHPEQFVVAELIREQVLHLTREEVPHSVAVIVEEMKAREDKDLVDIRCTIFVGKTHKGDYYQ